MESEEFIALAVKMGYATESQARQYVNSRRTKTDRVRLEKRCNNRDYYIRDERMRLVFNPQYLRWI